MRDFVRIKTVFFRKDENRLMFCDKPTYINPLCIEQITQGQDVTINGVKHSYFQIQLQTGLVTGISEELEVLFGQQN